MNTHLFQHLPAKGFLGLALGLCLTSVALAIPANQRDFDTDSFNTSQTTNPVIVPNTSVTVNNADARRNCVIQFSSELRSEQAGDGVELRNVLDSTSPSNCQTHGPEFVDFPSDDFDIRTLNWVREIPSGTHTIRVCARFRDVNGTAGGSVTLEFRTLTVECRTQ